MDKARQKYLQKWLRNQQKPIRNLLNINILLACISSVILVIQTYLLATLLHEVIINNTPRTQLISYFIGLLFSFALRALILWLREKIGFKSGKKLRNIIRQKIFDKINQVGPATISNKPAGSWATLMLEQVENLHNFYARFIPQQSTLSYRTYCDSNCYFPFKLDGWFNPIIYCTARPYFYDPSRIRCSR